MEDKPLFVIGANELITLKGSSKQPLTRGKMSELHILRDGAVWIEKGRIVSVGNTANLKKKYANFLSRARVIDASGKTVMPGLVDPHTHLVYAGSREDEFNSRLNGASYMEIMGKGGGIYATVRKTRTASEEELIEDSMGRLDSFLLHGVTTVEAKSGYGLDDWEIEYKQLKTAKTLNELHPVEIVSTFMAAHAIPSQFKDNAEVFVEKIKEEMLPKVVGEGLAQFQDVFCEKGVFAPQQAEELLVAGKKLGLIPKIHADEIEPYGGAELAAEVGAISADHLLKASKRGLEMMAEAGTIAVLLPGTAFFLMTEPANGRRILNHGVPVAISTDCNPGSSPTCSMPLMMNLACLKMGLSPAETISAATINAAHAIKRGSEIGSIEEGKKADLVICNVRNHLQLQYYFGMNHTDTVIKNGQVVVEGGRLCWKR